VTPRDKTNRLSTIVISIILILTLTVTLSMHVQGGEGYPPNASFYYWPVKPYQNMTVNFDASSSTPESVNDTITGYTWDFGDGTPKTTVTDPTITHAYLQATTFTVTLNVTDSQNLWGTMSKPITVLPEFGPTANFTWTPTAPVRGETATFNASNSTLGWSKTAGGFSPITSYTWNFADGTGNVTVTDPSVDHNFTLSGAYTVTLKITDAVSRTATTSANVQVQNKTVKAYDFNGDGIIDMKDIRRVAKAFGATPGSPHWDPVVDTNGDGIIDMKDIRAVTRNFGKDP
jgi:PKD repeat protein